MLPALAFISSKKDNYFMMMLFLPGRVTFRGTGDGALGSPHPELELILDTLSNHRRFWKKRLFQLHTE